MLQEKLSQAGPISIRELKELAAVQGPCITVIASLHPEDKRHGRLRLKKANEETDEKLAAHGVDLETRRALLEPLRGLDEELETGNEGASAVILRSRDVFRYHIVPQQLEDSVTVAQHFYLIPLLDIIWESRPFYVLALSQKHIRLVRCTNTSSEEVDLPPSVPRNFDDFIQTDKPDHVLDNSAAGGPGTGSMGRVMFGTGTDKERKDQYLLHFYRAVDRGISDLLKGDPASLVIAGVEYELPLYREVSGCPNLVEEGVRGAPDGLKGGELHARALQVVEAHWRKDIDDALAVYEQFGGSDRASASIKEIVKAAYDGRVLHLFVARGARHLGNFDEMTHKVRTHGQERPGDEDLINAAAIETLAHAGDVFIIPRSKVPHGSQMAAVMRY